MKKLKFKGKEYPLNWDIAAHDRILKATAASECKTLGDWLEKEPVKAYGIVLYELMCGGIRRHNFEIAMGMTGGKKIKLPEIPDEQRENILTLTRLTDMAEVKAMVSLCYSEATNAVVPEELKQFMPDDDYLEIAAELEKEQPDSEKN